MAAGNSSKTDKALIISAVVNVLKNRQGKSLVLMLVPFGAG
jgi:hypothetical protein